MNSCLEVRSEQTGTRCERKTKATTDTSGRNKMDLENNSMELECTECAVRMCVGWVFPVSQGLPLTHQLLSEDGLLCCRSESSWMVPIGLPYTHSVFSTLNHSACPEKLLISRHFTTQRWQRLSDRPCDSLLIRMLLKVLWRLLPPDKCQTHREGDHNFRANKIVEWCWFSQ